MKRKIKASPLSSRRSSSLSSIAFSLPVREFVKLRNDSVITVRRCVAVVLVPAAAMVDPDFLSTEASPRIGGSWVVPAESLTVAFKIGFGWPEIEGGFLVGGDVRSPPNRRRERQR
ncbi:hypothetical protein F2Q69_00020289 [Brassica cretica]|uniref:Uncharacterized protein n=1 Tax=Brassica cretica TaxID=69181 RepID=A0A8S9QJ55_BRACR|nr:hypothetical protein F2Q69_00020289 [Brassica cretica]